MARKPLISVHVKVAGFIDNKMVATEFDLEVPEKTTIKKLFTLVDKSGKIHRKAMKKIMAMHRPPTVLVNGLGIDVPDDFKTTLNPGDEIAIMTPLAGG